MQFNVADLLESLADAIPERTAVVAGDERLTFAELDRRSTRLANFLASRGVGRGQHVGLHLFNGAEYLVGMLAAFKLRAVPININYRYVAHELSYLFQDADLVALVSQREFAPLVAEATPRAPLLHTLLLVDDGSDAAVPGLESFDFASTIAGASEARSFAPRSGEDLFIIYTGGTTGMPKGVMWRHEDVFFAGLQGGNPGGTPIEKPEQLAENARRNEFPMAIVTAAPFIHGAAQWAALIALFGGGKVCILPGKSFNAARLCALIASERATTIILVGDAMARPLVEAIDAAPGEHDLSSLMVIASGGAVLSSHVKQRLREVLPTTMILNNFGATETGHQGSAVPGMDTGVEGRPSFFMDDTNAVLDDDNRPIAPGSGKIGRLARRGRVPVGYYNDAVKTAHCFVTLEGVRYSIPGDFATVEVDGRITVYGRGSVCINSGGEKIFPEEVEEALKSHPEVFDVVVVGVADERWMQRVAAVVQGREGKQPSLASLQEHARKSVAGYKVPRQVTFVDQVQRQPSGKPDYGWAKELATDRVDQREAH